MHLHAHQTQGGKLHVALVYSATAPVGAKRGAVHHLTAHLVCYAGNSLTANSKMLVACDLTSKPILANMFASARVQHL